jgi:biotin carboxyl carrier protein
MAEVTTSCDGEIQEIRVEIGDVVRRNQELMIVASSELSTLILAAESGVVKKICVKSGDRVKAGQILAYIET